MRQSCERIESYNQCTSIMARDVKVAVVGAGGAAQVVHLPILGRLPDVEVVGIVDPQLAKAETVADRFHIPRFTTSFEELTAEVSPEAVLVCSPTGQHEAVVIQALESGAHVLCERPLTVSSSSAERILAVAREADRELMVAMNLRFRFDMRAIRQFVLSGELGDVVHIRSTWMNRRYRRPRGGWRGKREISGGGALMDLGAQAVDIAMWLLDYPAVERVTASLGASGDDVEASAFALIDLEGGRTVTVEVSWELPDEKDRHEVVVLGTGGTARTSPFRVQTRMETGIVDVTPPLPKKGPGLYTDSYRQEWAEFLRMVRGETEGYAPVEQVDLMEILEACYESAEAGRGVVR
jgi:predicted dehydrogenase